MSLIYLKNIIKEHSSFIILLLSSISIFSVNILLHELISAKDYGVYSLIVTLISIFSSLGLLGIDHVILRTAKITSNIKLDYRLIFLSLIIPLFLSYFASITFLDYYNFNFSVNYFIFLLYLVAFSRLMYQLLRISSNFIHSQIVLNFWKIALFIIVSVYLFFKNDTINLNLIISCINVFMLIGIIFCINKLSFLI